uniref:histidine kinase n=1 Tax=Tetraselmis sp. GSL018 TaxID=582737 RepID=A0A061RT08_9CHLO
MFCVDTSGCVTDWNDAMERLTGLEKHAAIGKVAVGEIFGSNGMVGVIASEGSPDAMTEMSAMMVNVLGSHCGHAELENGAIEPQQTEDVHSDNGPTSTLRFFRVNQGTQPGSSKQVEISISCRNRIGSSGEVSGVFFFVQDLTLPKALEKAIAVQMAAEAAADAKTRHIAFLCHEIRNPVNGILATVQAMDEVMETAQESEDRSEVDVGELSELIRTMMACTDQLRRTVDGILDINKLEEGKLGVNVAPLMVNNIFRTVISQIGRAAEEKGLWLKSEVDPPELADMHFLGDEGRIQQILANFCWNSVKFTSKGGITMTVEAEEGATPDRRRLFWKVIDTGKGMSQKTQASLFERYAMGKHKVGKYGGSGLGLSICRSLAELMKGHVHCVSALGKGSTFVLEVELEVDKTKCQGHRRRSGSKTPTRLQSQDTGDTRDVVSENALQARTSEEFHEDVKSSEDHGTRSREVRSHSRPQWRRLSISNQAGGSMSESLHLSQDPTSMTVLREVVQEKSVAVLVEVRRGEVVRQHWGGAAIGPEGMGQALVEANDDALRRAQLSMGGPSFAPALPHPAASAPVTADMNIGLRQPAEPAPATGKVPDETAGGRDKTTAQLLEDSASPAPADGPQRKVSAREKAAQRRAARSKGQSARPGQAPAPARPEGGMRTVLVVDDDPVNTKVLYRALSKAGLEVVIGEDGQDVVQLCINEGKRFDMALLDENMRHMNGTTACIVLRKYERDRGLPAMPVVVTTGNTAMHDNLLYYGCGMNGVLTKPMNMRTIAQDLDSYFRHCNDNGNVVDMTEVVASLDAVGSQQPDDCDRLSTHGGPESFEELLMFGELKVFGRLKDFALGDAYKAAGQAAALQKE